MNFNTFYNKITTDENLMETIQHGSNEYPFKFYNDNLALFDFHCIEWHWHTELEFVYVESGVVTFWIGEKKFELSEGNGVFINSKVLHRFYSSCEAIIPNFVFMPSFIAPYNSCIYQKYVLPVISSSRAFQIFQLKVSWQAEILEIIKRVIEIQNSISSCELMTSYLVQMLWQRLYGEMDFSYVDDHLKKSASSQARLQLMIQYISSNYQRNISLDDIAACAQISKSAALKLFQKYLQTTPVNFLINYRLNEAAQLLSKTEKKVNAISSETGFHNVDYFCRLFKKHYQLTPTQYRKKKLENL